MVNWEGPWLGAAQLGSAQMLHHPGDERGEKPRPSQGSLTSGVTPRTFRKLPQSWAQEWLLTREIVRHCEWSECELIRATGARSELYKSIISTCTQLLLTWPWSAHTCSNMTTWGHWVSSVQCQAWTPSVVTPADQAPPHTPGLAWGNFWRNSDWCKGDQWPGQWGTGQCDAVSSLTERRHSGPWPSPVWSKPVSLHPTHSTALAQDSLISFSKINSCLPI